MSLFPEGIENSILHVTKGLSSIKIITELWYLHPTLVRHVSPVLGFTWL